MGEADLPGATDVYALCFGVEVSGQARGQRGLSRVRHAMGTDPGGAFVALRDGQVIGFAQATVRERLWCLTLMAVHPAAQSTGAGRALFDHALTYGAPIECGLIVSSNDSRALRLYASAGFSLWPALRALGPVKQVPTRPPAPTVREGDASDLEALADLSRAIRGSAHTPELTYVLALGARLLIVEGRGFAVTHPESGVQVLVAHDEEAATALLWGVLERSRSAERPIGWIPGGQDWAVRVAVDAGLKLVGYGALCVLGDPGPLRPYLPNGSFA
jgi:GNAT superfamily N-acetyltransferase